MGLRDNLNSSLKKGGLSGGEIHPPSRAYERYFEGYTESAQVVPNRRRAKSVRVYVGQLYTQELPAGKRRILRLLYALLFLLSLPPLLVGGIQDIPANKTWYVTLPQAASLLFLGWMAVGLARYCTLPREMTARQYRTGVVHFRRSQYGACGALAVTALAYAVSAILYAQGRAGAALGALLCCFSCGCILAILLLGRGEVYTERANPRAEAPEST